jgi:hypothetical protein
MECRSYLGFGYDAAAMLVIIHEIFWHSMDSAGRRADCQSGSKDLRIGIVRSIQQICVHMPQARHFQKWKLTCGVRKLRTPGDFNLVGNH